MKRKVVSLLLITLPLLLAAVILQFPVTAAPVQQAVPAETETPLAQPQQILIRQQVPLTFTVVVSTPITGTGATTNTNNLIGALINSIARPTTSTPAVTVQTIGVILTLDLQLTVTDTLTTTVPSTVTLTLADQQTTSMPVSVTIGSVPGADVVITLLPSPEVLTTPTTALTATVEITSVTAVSPTAGTTNTIGTVSTPPVGPLVAITGTVAITANLRAGPDTTFDAIGTTTAGQTVTVVARNADSAWYLLESGVWIAASLVENIGGDLPLATEELATTLRAQNTVTTTLPVTTTTSITTTTAPTATTPPTTTTPVTITTPATTTTPITTTSVATTTGSIILVPTPTAVAQPAQPPRVTLDANLRAGPGITFPIIGGTVTGQELTIVARNEDGSWLQLDNGGWVATFLVANPPLTTTVPLFVEGGAQPAATATPTPGPTSTPAPSATSVFTSSTPTLGVRENLYVIRVDGIVDGYDFTLTKIDDLVAQAGEDATLLQDRAWIVEMTTAITLLRSTGEEATGLSAPPIFATAHADLVKAAASFTAAADLLAEGVDQLDTARLDEAFAEITTGSNLLTRAQSAIDLITP